MNLRELLILKAAGGGGSRVEKTATGNPVAFTTQLAKPVKSITVPLSYTQAGSGDPSPTNIRPISGVSSLSAYRTGVNIFDEVFEEGMLYDSTGQDRPSSDNIRSKNYIPVVPGKKYYFKYNAVASGTNMRLFYYGADKSYKSNQWVNGARSYTMPSDAYYIRFYMDTSYTASGNRKISINYPYTETDYVPYNGTEVDVVFPVDVGTIYGGSLDLVSGVLTIDRWMFIENGEHEWGATAQTSNTRFILGKTLFPKYPKSSSTSNLRVNYMKNSDSGNSWTAFIGSTGNFLCYAPTDVATTKSEWQAYLAEHPIQICYELETPYTVQLTPNQINAIKGNNTVWTDTTGDLTIKYLDKA